MRTSLLAQLVNNPPAMQETLVRFLGREDLLKGEATHSSILGLLLWLSWQRIHLQCGRPGFDHWVRKIPWRRERLPTPVFWPGKFHGLYSPQGRQEVDTTEGLSLHFQEIGPESGLNWSLPVSSGISSLKPAKTHTGAFPGSSRSQLDRKSSVVQTS